ncbi:hypothetical protein DFH08DRAFT_1028937 [Mycena albidolilacea]|uniref:Uncharacterized protein n=1 Tax=Mycena albidolilacea TaxID=1033008 RepID=A0AAD6ZIW4_9AGAR|nr:hypothetical protein DFH08DRAFT_1028937 [Mycena albidolilacea]
MVSGRSGRSPANTLNMTGTSGTSAKGGAPVSRYRFQSRHWASHKDWRGVYLETYTPKCIHIRGSSPDEPLASELHCIQAPDRQRLPSSAAICHAVPTLRDRVCREGSAACCRHRSRWGRPTPAALAYLLFRPRRRRHPLSPSFGLPGQQKETPPWPLMRLSTVSEGHVGDFGRIVTVTSVIHTVGKDGAKACFRRQPPAPGALTARPAIAHQVDLERPPATDYVALGSAALGRGAADTPSVA